MADVSLQNADGAVLVFSVEDQETFEQVSKLRDLIVSKYPSLPTVIVGNKTDKERRLPFEEIEATVCLDWECGYVECSAKEKDNLQAILRELANQARVVPQVTPSSPARSTQSSSSEKRHSVTLFKRLFSRESSRDLGLENYKKCSSLKKQESCKIS